MLLLNSLGLIARKSRIVRIVLIYAVLVLVPGTSTHASPSFQVDSPVDVDGQVISVSPRGGSNLGVRLCNSGKQLTLDPDIANGRIVRKPVVGRYYHFHNAYILERDGFLAWDEKFTMSEISGCPSAAPPQVNFSVDQNNLMLGQCATLRWDADNVQAIFLDGQGITGHESRRVCPNSTTTYTLRAVTNSGDINRTVTINVQIPEPQLELQVDRSTIIRGECTTLRWAAAYVQSMSLDGRLVGNPGTQQVCPQSTTAYILRATAASGPLSRSITVSVVQPSPTPTSRPTSTQTATPVPTEAPTLIAIPSATNTPAPIVKIIPPQPTPVSIATRELDPRRALVDIALGQIPVVGGIKDTIDLVSTGDYEKKTEKTEQDLDSALEKYGPDSPEYKTARKIHEETVLFDHQIVGPFAELFAWLLNVTSNRAR